MTKLPVVAIIGRPNTGKSTLFNRLIGKRVSIESPVPGTTRDHVSGRADFSGVPAILIDTGGIGASRDKEFEEDVRGQSLLAVEFADVILFAVNGQEDITSDDRTVMEALRRRRRRHVPVLVVITKIDTPGQESLVTGEYQELAIGSTMIAVSAPHRLGISKLSEAIAAHLRAMHLAPPQASTKSTIHAHTDENADISNPAPAEKETSAGPPRIAIIGTPNVGKSSIVNALMSEGQRRESPALVSPIAGTTRDAVDTEIMHHGKPYILVDTAGLKKHARSLDDIERYAMMRTVTAVENSDVVILVLDASRPVSAQDKRVAALAVDSGKGIVILLNKIDTMKGKKREEVIDFVKDALHFCTKFAVMIPCSAKSREGLLKLFDVVESVQRSRTLHISTRELHRWYEQYVHGKPLGQVARVKHLTQTKDIPPTFVLFCKHPEHVKPVQLRFMENRLRESFGFDGTPIRWILKGGEEDEGGKKRRRA